MSDLTVKFRVARMKNKRQKLGWKKVTVWVSCEEEADIIKALATKFRRKATKV